MQLLSAVLLAAVAVVCADTGYEQGYEYSQPSNSDYYQPRPKPGGLTGLLQRFFGGSSSKPFTDRQQTGPGTGVGPVGPPPSRIGGILELVVPVLLMLGGQFLLTFVFSLLPSLTSSGRGLDVDEWEIDHSVWLGRLKADFENSWSTE